MNCHASHNNQNAYVVELYVLGLMSKQEFSRQTIRVGIIGAGAMGKGLFYQCHITPNFQCVALADIQPQRAVDCANWLKYKYDVATGHEDIDRFVRADKMAICSDGDLVACSDSVDVVIESSSSIRSAAKYAVSALAHGKHLVLMNAEVDLAFGPYLMDLARKNKVTYTSCDGDQHGVIKRITDDIKLWGFDLVTAGNIKGFLDRYSNPTKIVPEADKRRLDYRMATAYTDGTKLNIEMALLANSLGLITLKPGMHGPKAGNVQEVFQLFNFEELWKDKAPFVDYILGAEPGGGVFVVGHCDDEYQRFMMDYYKMGKGPFYLFYRPYHLCHVESMESVRDAVLDGKSLLQPSAGFQTNVYAYAKRDLKIGEKLDGLGGYACYGMIENCGKKGDESLPICLANEVVLRRNISKDEKIYLSDIDFDPGRIDFDLYDKALRASSNFRR
jgi:predicted homoserine dehydrogenase-like protein